MRTRKLLTTVGLLCALGGALSACTETNALKGLSSDKAAQTTDQNSPSAACNVSEATLEPLMAAPENTPIFELFNFQPHAIEINEGVVTVKTKAYTFAFLPGRSHLVNSFSSR